MCPGQSPSWPNTIQGGAQSGIIHATLMILQLLATYPLSTRYPMTHGDPSHCFEHLVFERRVNWDLRATEDKDHLEVDDGQMEMH